MNDAKPHKTSGFTIVELLVVIVVIGILAALTIVSYAKVSQRATIASLQSDLSNGANRLKLYYVDHGTYPQSLDASNCPTGPTDTRYCLNPSMGSIFAYTSSFPYSTFILDATSTSSNTRYEITNTTSPTYVITTPITAVASISGSTSSVGSVLSAGSLTPGGATASYQWLSSTSSGGTYSNISGATSSSYSLATTDLGMYLKVVATGTGSYSGQLTSSATALVSDSNWIAGVVGHDLEGKFVRSTDLGSQYKFRPTMPAATPPQAVSNTLVSPQSNPSVDFSEYPAQNACKAIGGRLPTYYEGIAIYQNLVTYGNNFQAASRYWTAYDGGSTTGAYYWFSGGSTGLENFKYSNLYVRCVVGG